MGGGGPSGELAQAASAIDADRMALLRNTRCGECMFEGGMWIFYLEMLVVLAVAGFIVWWTLPKKKPPPEQSGTAPPEPPPQN